MTEPGQSAEKMDHLTTDCSKASSGHPSAENDATAILTLAGTVLRYGATFKRYGDGAVMLKQGVELVYLDAEQFAELKKFMGAA